MQNPEKELLTLETQLKAIDEKLAVVRKHLARLQESPEEKQARLEARKLNVQLNALESGEALAADEPEPEIYASDVLHLNNQIKKAQERIESLEKERVQIQAQITILHQPVPDPSAALRIPGNRIKLPPLASPPQLPVEEVAAQETALPHTLPETEGKKEGKERKRAFIIASITDHERKQVINEFPDQFQTLFSVIPDSENNTFAQALEIILREPRIDPSNIQYQPNDLPIHQHPEVLDFFKNIDFQLHLIIWDKEKQSYIHQLLDKNGLSVVDPTILNYRDKNLGHMVLATDGNYYSIQLFPHEPVPTPQPRQRPQPTIVNRNTHRLGLSSYATLKAQWEGTYAPFHAYRQEPMNPNIGKNTAFAATVDQLSSFPTHEGLTFQFPMSEVMEAKLKEPTFSLLTLIFMVEAGQMQTASDLFDIYAEFKPRNIHETNSRLFKISRPIMKALAKATLVINVLGAISTQPYHFSRRGCSDGGVTKFTDSPELKRIKWLSMITIPLSRNQGLSLFLLGNIVNRLNMLINSVVAANNLRLVSQDKKKSNEEKMLMMPSPRSEASSPQLEASSPEGKTVYKTNRELREEQKKSSPVNQAVIISFAATKSILFLLMVAGCLVVFSLFNEPLYSAVSPGPHRNRAVNAFNFFLYYGIVTLEIHFTHRFSMLSDQLVNFSISRYIARTQNNADDDTKGEKKTQAPDGKKLTHRPRRTMDNKGDNKVPAPLQNTLMQPPASSPKP